MRMTRIEMEVLLRHDLPAFIERVFCEINSGAEYLDNWHIEAMAYELMRCINGENNRLVINVPPRHLKSICVSVALSAFILGHDPSAEIICVSYSNELLAKHARDFRKVVEARSYKRLFPETRIDRRKNSELELVTTKNGGRYATSKEGCRSSKPGRPRKFWHFSPPPATVCSMQTNVAIVVAFVREIVLSRATLPLEDIALRHQGVPPRIHGGSLKPGIDVSQATMTRYMVRHPKPPSQTWRIFLDNHKDRLDSIDFLVVPTAA